MVSFNFQAALDKSPPVIADKDVYAIENELQLASITVYQCVLCMDVYAYVCMSLLASSTGGITRLASIITYGHR